MKNKIILGLFATAIFYSCTTQKTVVEEKKVVVEENKQIFTPKKEEAKVEAHPLVMVENVALAEGKSLYETNCAKCHKLFDPKDFNAEEWKPIVLSMQKKARISDEHREKIYAYLTTP